VGEGDGFKKKKKKKQLLLLSGLLNRQKDVKARYTILA
jgi:hypothetical protein